MKRILVPTDFSFLPKTHYKLPLQLQKKIVKYFAAFRIAASNE
jgi:hypothetical protein